MQSTHKFNMTVKIAFFLPSLEGAGAEKVLATLANSFVRRGYEIDFVLSSAKGPFLSNLDPQIKIINLERTHVIDSFFSLGNYLRSQKPQVMISGLSNANLAALAAGRLFSPSCKVIITQHSNWSQKLANNPTRKEQLVFQLSRFLYPFAARIVAVSSITAEEIKHTFRINPKKVLFIYNPVVTQELIDKSRQSVNHRWLNHKTVPVVLGAGRLIKSKDFNTLIQAFAIVLKKIDCRMLIIGEGPEHQNLQNLIQNSGLCEKIELLGFVPNPYPFMTQADLFVLSSLNEGLPTVLIEALACGTTVVSTDCLSGPAEILDDGKYGSLVPIQAPETLSEAVIESLRHPKNKDLLTERAAFFSVENASKAYLDLIEQVLVEK